MPRKRKWKKGESSWVAPDRVQKRGRPANSYLSTLKTSPSKADWEALVARCVEAIVNKESSILISMSYLTKWPKDFPQPYIVEDNGLTIVYKVRAKRLLRWLFENGYTSISIRELQMQQRRVTMMTQGVDEMFGNNVEYNQCWIDELEDEEE